MADSWHSAPGDRGTWDYQESQAPFPPQINTICRILPAEADDSPRARILNVEVTTLCRGVFRDRGQNSYVRESWQLKLVFDMSTPRWTNFIPPDAGRHIMVSGGLFGFLPAPSLPRNRCYAVVVNNVSYLPFERTSRMPASVPAKRIRRDPSL